MKRDPSEAVESNLAGIIPSLAAEAETAMAAGDSVCVDEVRVSISGLQALLSKAQYALNNVNTRIINYKVSGDPDVITKGRNDF